MTLDDWLSNRWLSRHRTTPQEIADLLAVAERDLQDCQVTGLSADARLSLAYSAAVQLATAALAAAGYRPGRAGPHHHWVIQSLAHTIEAADDLVSQLDKFRKKRNVLAYERAGYVSDQEADEMRQLALALRQRVEGWLRRRHPGLLAP